MFNVGFRSDLQVPTRRQRESKDDVSGQRESVDDAT